jgi:cytochrome P450
VDRASSFPLGAAVTLEQLERDPHPVLASLREREPVSWLPALDGWLITRYDLALQAMRDAETFTVDDPRFSTAQVIGPSMLSLDGAEHERHRAPFIAPFRAAQVRGRFADATAHEVDQLIDALESTGGADLRRAFAGALAASIVTRALGLDEGEAGDVLGWYDAIVRGVTQITAGAPLGDEAQNAFAELQTRLRSVIDKGGESLLAAAATARSLNTDQVVSNAAVLLFGGIETTEGMIANALLHLLERPQAVETVRREPERMDVAIEESLRLEPAAAVIDRYATAGASLGDAQIAKGELVRLSIAGANRDPGVFQHPDRFDLGRRNSRRHLAFAQGPHVCVGVHLARLEARTAVATLVNRLRQLRLDPERPSVITGLVFRKPSTLHVRWD